MATDVRDFEQENRRIAATWRAMGAAIPEQHSSGDDTVLQISADIAASSEHAANQEEQFASETDQRAADLDAKAVSRCEGDSL